MKTLTASLSNKERRFWLFAWLLLGIALLLFFFSDVFFDFLETYAEGYGFLDALFHGEFFYSYSHAKTILADAEYSEIRNAFPIYNAILYMTFAVWSIPVWIIKRFADVYLWTPGVILWYKTLLALAATGCAIRINKIVRRRNPDKSELSVFLFLSSFLFVLMTLDETQYDILGLYPMILALDELDRRKQITFRFLICFALATAFKGLPFFFLLPAVILIEKKVLKIVAYTICGLLPMILNPLIFGGDDIFIENMTKTHSSWSSFLISTTIPGGTENIPVFLVLWVLICIWAYASKQDENVLKSLTWLGMAVYGTFLCFVFNHPQWAIMIVPFLIFGIVLNEDYTWLNMVLEFIGTFSLSFFYVLKYPNVFWNNRSMRDLLTKRLGIYNWKDISFADYWYKYLGTDLNKIFFGVFVACMVAIVYLNSKRVKNVETNSNVPKAVIILKPLFLIGFWLVDFAFNNIYIADKIERIFG